MARLGAIVGPFPPIRIEPSARPWVGVVQELDLQAALVAHLEVRAGESTRVSVEVLCHGLKPDIVVEQEHDRVVTIVELKRWVIDKRAVSQISNYVEHWRSHRSDDWIVRGILAAPALHPALVLPPWCAFQALTVAGDPRSEPVVEKQAPIDRPRSRPVHIAEILAELTTRGT